MHIREVVQSKTINYRKCLNLWSFILGSFVHGEVMAHVNDAYFLIFSINLAEA